MFFSKQKLLLGVSLAALTAISTASAQPVQSMPAQKVAAVPYITPELTSGIALSEIYSDNIYAARTAKTSDWITQVSPFLNLNLKGQKGEANIGGRADIGRYAQFSTEDYNDYWLYADGRYDYRVRSSCVVRAARLDKRRGGCRSGCLGWSPPTPPRRE